MPLDDRQQELRADGEVAAGAVGGRIAGIDLIRGIAVMGILAMNIVDFAMPGAAYLNPRAWGGWHGWDLAAWAAAFVLADGKMRCLFSMLFGASMLLVADAAAARGDDPGRVHRARMGWLLAFGLAHIVLLWDGDILNSYALIGLALWPLRRLTVVGMGALAALLIGTQALLMAVTALDVAAVARHGGAAAAGYASAFGVPDRAALARELALHRGGWAGLATSRAAGALDTVLNALGYIGLETAGYMLLGMAAFRLGFFTGRPRRRAYRALALVGAAALLGYAGLAALEVAHGFSLTAVAWSELPLAAPLRPLAAAGIAAAALLWLDPAGRLARRIAAAGRMAFSNYLLTSLICTSLFYGYGAGLYGRLGRAESLGVAALIWVAMLLWSPAWLARFRYGPLEWLWRSLARGRWQPLWG